MAKRTPTSRSADSPPDETLFARFLQGEKEAFDTLVLRYKDRAYWVAYSIIRDMDESLDLSQEAFARALTAARTFDLRQKFSTWFFRILVNLCIDTLRKRKTRRTVTGADAPEPEFSGPGPGENLHKRELKAMVAEILQALPENHRTLLVLRDIDGRSCIEIAEIVGCTHATARWRLHRARGKFREAWEERFGPWGAERPAGDPEEG
ncbi:MAG: RNA polymerase sigma factor [Planctomycetota bacterium]|jgi:RNA polymerase sigma-70 factor (ECF subfamily)